MLIMNKIVIIGLVLLFIYIYYISTINYPIFLKKEVAQDFLKQDPDYYFRNLTDIELKSKGYNDIILKNNINNYIEDSIECIGDWTHEEKKILERECIKADQFLNNFKMDHFPNKLVARIKWKLVKVIDSKYCGYKPHTRMDMIFIPDYLIKNSLLRRLLVHEKCHVFSRLYPDKMSEWNVANGFKIYKKRNEYKLRLSNPDVDDWVYIDSKGRETIALHDTKTNTIIYPDGSDDSLHTEHPNETLAYLVADNIKKGKLFVL
jgi:hypothetical protein